MTRFALAGTLCVALALSACGGSSDAPSGNGDETATEDGTSTEEGAAAGDDGRALTEDADATTEQTSQQAATAAAATEFPAAFTQCSVCHKVAVGEHGLGPSLAGVFGSTAGTRDGFDYSSAMADSGMVWNEANLDRYLTNPREALPGNTMAYPGMRDAAQRKAVIDYLKTL